jgi:hypothetical protein
MDPTIFFNALVSYGPPGVAAAFFLYKWQKAEDRIEKLRDAFELKTKEYYESLLATQKAGFDNSLRVEGVLGNATQQIATNTVALHAVVSNGRAA